MPAKTSDSKYDIPVPSFSQQNIPDPDAGYVYIVTDTRTVEQVRIDNLQKRLDAAKSAKAQAEQVIADLQPQVDALALAAPVIDETSATSSPKI